MHATAAPSLPSVVPSNTAANVCVCDALCVCGKYLTPDADLLSLLLEGIRHAEKELSLGGIAAKRVAALRTRIRRNRLALVYQLTVEIMSADGGVN